MACRRQRALPVSKPQSTAPWSVIVVAGGRGARMDQPTPKQEQLLGEVAVVEHAMKAFDGLGAQHHVLVAPEHIQHGEAWSQASPGATRCRSVLNGLRQLQVDADHWVAVHDAARPFVSHKDIKRVLAARDRCPESSDGVVLCAPLADAVYAEVGVAGWLQPAGGRVSLRGQTPQLFRYDPLVTALESALSLGRSVADEASVVMRHVGGRAIAVMASSYNDKLTVPADLEVMDGLIKSRRPRG